MDHHPYAWLAATAVAGLGSGWAALAVATQDGWNGLVALLLAALIASVTAFLAVVVKLLRATFKNVSAHSEEIGTAWGERITAALLRFATRKDETDG